jgi:release factor glutamine methyltransferase
MTIKQLYEIACVKLSKVSDNPKIESLVILEYAMGLKKEIIFAYPEKEIEKDKLEKFEKILYKRVNERIPISYIIKEKEFYSLKFYVDENVLIPRPETEKIVDMSLEFLKNKKNPRILDIGTGSGNIITAISYYNTIKAKYFALDISYKAINIAKLNAEKNKQKISFIISNLLDGIKKNRMFDLIVANPPYISKEEFKELSSEVMKEPKIALLAKEKGVYYINKIMELSKMVLKKGGMIIIEIGEEQSNIIKNMKKLNIKKDYFGKERFIVINFD